MESSPKHDHHHEDNQEEGDDKYFDNLDSWTETPGVKECSVALLKEIKSLNVLKSDETSLLDFGCADGINSFALINDIKDVTGTDISKNMLDHYSETAKKLNVNHKTETIHTSKNPQELLEAGKKWNVIIVAFVLHHANNVEEIISILSEVLEKDGYLLIAEMISFGSEFEKKILDNLEKKLSLKKDLFKNFKPVFSGDVEEEAPDCKLIVARND